MTDEPELTKKISNDTIETWYYVLFWLAAISAGLVLLLELYVMSISPKRGFLMLLRSAPMLILAVVNTLFLYILSARALK
jgi:hypothetical protein